MAVRPAPHLLPAGYPPPQHRPEIATAERIDGEVDGRVEGDENVADVRRQSAIVRQAGESLEQFLERHEQVRDHGADVAEDADDDDDDDDDGDAPIAAHVAIVSKASAAAVSASATSGASGRVRIPLATREQISAWTERLREGFRSMEF